MTITAALPTVLPNRQQEPEVFVPAMDDFFASLPEIASQIDIAIAAFNFNDINDTSTTSNQVDSLGDKTFTVSINKSFRPGMWLTIADAAAPTENSISGQVKTYISTTLVFTAISFRGTGTKTDWVISMGAASPALTAGAQLLHLHTGNGHGSTNNKIRRMTTTVTNTGALSWTYADSASLGGSITFVASGVYSANYIDANASAQHGLSLNSNQLTTAIESITETHKLMICSEGSVTAGSGVTFYAASGDVLRMHTDGSMTDTAGVGRFRLERLF